MSGLFRSESMVYVRLLMNDEAAYDTVRQLAQFGKAHIVDLSLRHGGAAPSERIAYYKKRVASAAFYERKLLALSSLFGQYGIEAPVDVDPVPLPQGDVLEQLRAYIEPLEWGITKDVLSAREQRTALTSLHEHEAVLRMVGSGGLGGETRARTPPLPRYGTFEEAALLGGDDGSSMDETTDEEKGDISMRGLRAVRPTRQFISQRMHGVVNEDKAAMFERMIFRVSRGNVVTKTESIDRSALEETTPAAPGAPPPPSKRVFSLTFVGEQMARRLRKIITYFGATEYEVPQESRDAQRLLLQILQRIQESRVLLRATETQVRASLQNVAWDDTVANSPYINYMRAILVEKAICDALKKCELERVGGSTLRCEMWLPADDYPQLAGVLKAAVQHTGLQPAACQVMEPAEARSSGLGAPPTYFRTNKFTSAYQGIVDTYGVPRYKEANPGLFTLISFPFLFGIMYGDIGHGTLLTLGALYFIVRERHYERELRLGRMDEILSMVFGGRYLLVLMGLFAVYAGLIYNDCFSIPLNLFGSSWIHGGSGEAVHGGGVYPFGVDPGWYHTSNGLAFFNSLKMKLAVTLGVAQMTFGIALGAANNLYFGDRLALLFEFVPRLLFMVCTFGYMIFLILYKFCIDWSVATTRPPNLVQTMIGMFLQPGSVDPQQQLYAGQAGVQVVLLLIAVGCVPVMLLAQPLLARREHQAIWGGGRRRKRSDGARYERVGHKDASSVASASSSSLHHSLAVSDHAHDDDAEHDDVHKDADQLATQTEATHVDPSHEAVDDEGGHGPNPKSPHYSFSDHLIIQGIHTIEFVLGAVSNTASYLRLWALSLAHAELSEVFWSKMISQYGLETGSPIMLVIGMAVWSGATFAVLLAMDVLECFLHALRLHWVEFQNKFYHGDGYAYHPFSFDNLDATE